MLVCISEVGVIWVKTYSAAGGGAASVVATVLAVGVLALAADVIANNLDGEFELGIGRRRVLEDGHPSASAAVADTKVERSEVAPRVGG